jgi:hypothetical protein
MSHWIFNRIPLTLSLSRRGRGDLHSRLPVNRSSRCHAAFSPIAYLTFRITGGLALCLLVPKAHDRANPVRVPAERRASQDEKA